MGIDPFEGSTPMITNNNENGGYRTPSKPPKNEIKWKFDPLRVFRTILFVWMALVEELFENPHVSIWGFTFFFAIPILILISLAVSLLLVGSVSLWGYHILFWYSMPFIGLWIYKSLHLDNPLIWGKFQDWVKKRTE